MTSKHRVMDIADEVAEEWVHVLSDYLAEEWGMPKGEEKRIREEWSKVWRETVDDPMGRMQLLQMMQQAGITPEEQAAFSTSMLGGSNATI